MKSCGTVAGRTEQTRIRQRVGLGLFLGVLLVRGAVAMTLPGKPAANVATSHHSIALVEVAAR